MEYIFIRQIEEAVVAVMGTTVCDEEMLWEAPNSLLVHLAKLQNWCGAQEKPLKSKVPNIVKGMLGTIQDAYEGEIYKNLLTNETWIVKVPAPVCALEALAQGFNSLLFSDFHIYPNNNR